MNSVPTEKRAWGNVNNLKKQQLTLGNNVDFFSFKGYGGILDFIYPIFTDLMASASKWLTKNRMVVSTCKICPFCFLWNVESVQRTNTVFNGICYPNASKNKYILIDTIFLGNTLLSAFR